MNAMPQKLGAPPADGEGRDIPSYDARSLIPDGVQARIVLDGQIYTLRITRAGKLILTK